MYTKILTKLLKYGKGVVPEHIVQALKDQPEILADKYDDEDDFRGPIVRRVIGQNSHPDYSNYYLGGYVANHAADLHLFGHKFGVNNEYDLEFAPVVPYNKGANSGQPATAVYLRVYGPGIPLERFSSPSGKTGIYTPEEALDIVKKIPDEKLSQTLENNMYKAFPHLKPPESAE